MYSVSFSRVACKQASRTWILVVMLLAVLASVSARADTPVYAWAEAEKPASANFQFETQATDRPGLLSGGKWLFKSIAKEDTAKTVPAEGFLLNYDLPVAEDGTYQVWARVGFEWVRPPLEWRLGDGAWTKVGIETRTTNLMELGTWTEAAWLPLGSAALRAGTTHLQLRYREPGSDGRMLLALDCLALVKGHWIPDGKLRPGETYAGETDQAAEKNVFRFASVPADSSARVQLPLNGLWQAARYDDPNMDAGRYEPVTTLPDPADYPLHWMGVNIPSSAWNTPELAYGHRLLYRARIDVPAAMRGRSFTLHFSGTNWIVSVFVNGALIGTHTGVLVPWDMDITKGVRPGEMNEITVAVKGSYYAMDAKELEKVRNIPNEGNFLSHVHWIAPIYPSSKGEGDGIAYGLVNPVTLTVAGPAYVSDVFVRTSVANKRLDADVTLTNPGAEARTLTVGCEAVNLRTGQVEKTFPPVETTLAPGEEKALTTGGEWANPKLWWPVDDPELYTLRTTVSEGGKPLDVQNQTFGFREITVDGIHLRLNGVIRNFWNWVEVSGSPSNTDEWLKEYRAEGNRFYRFASDSILTRFLPTREERLDFYDRHGIPGRLSTCVDGMFITYDLHNPLVWKNFDEHIKQVTQAYRNHPSILLYSVENELMYINAQNVYGGEMDQMEQKELEMVRGGQANDPTRPFMGDGAGALKGNLLPINCQHYPEAAPDTYPDNAYTLAAIDDHCSRWPWDRKRPLILGETFFYAGKLEDQAWIGGDRVFRGRDEANKGASRFVRLMMEGYRWQGVAGTCPWVAEDHLPGIRTAFSDLAVFTRKQTYRFTAGGTGSVLVKVLNDTLSDAPVTFTWAVTLPGKRVASGAEILRLAPGTGQERTLHFTLPPASARTDGTLLLRVAQNGKVGFEESKSIAVLPPITRLAVDTKNGPLLLFDRSGRLAPYLRARQANPLLLSAPAQLKGRTGVLLIGPDTLTAAEASSPDLLAFAARGGRVIVLEQETPLAGAALPAAAHSTSHFGGYAFAQALGTPLFAGFKADDFTDWAGDAPTYEHAYLKPAGGARSLVECGSGLNYSALMEMPCGRGVITTTQLRVGAKLGVDPAADHLLQNLLEVYSRYVPPHGLTAVYAPADSPLGKALAAGGVLSAPAASLEAALNPARFRVAVIPASAANLRALLHDSSLLDRFTQAGGWVMLWGLQPDGLDTYNRLVGVSHLIRPFRLERVTMEAPENPLAATLGNRDLTFYSPRELAFGDYFLSDNVYSYVVGGEDAAPFCRMPDGPEDLFAYKPTYDDHDPYNYVNGLFNSDSWRYIRQIWIDKEGAKPLVFGFRRPAVIRQVNVWNNTNYWTIKDLDIIFDGDQAHPLHVVLPANGSLNAIKIAPARRVAKSITLQIRSWRGETKRTPDGQELRLVGIDDIQFLRQIAPEEARKSQPLDNIGGLVVTPRGRGGLLLNQLQLTGDAPNSENAAKKIRLMATLLQNMGAGMRSSFVSVRREP